MYANTFIQRKQLQTYQQVYIELKNKLVHLINFRPINGIHKYYERYFFQCSPLRSPSGFISVTGIIRTGKKIELRKVWG